MGGVDSPLFKDYNYIMKPHHLAIMAVSAIGFVAVGAFFILASSKRSKPPEISAEFKPANNGCSFDHLIDPTVSSVGTLHHEKFVVCGRDGRKTATTVCYVASVSDCSHE